MKWNWQIPTSTVVLPSSQRKADVLLECYNQLPETNTSPHGDHSWSYSISSHLPLASPLSLLQFNNHNPSPQGPPGACHQSRVVPLFLPQHRGAFEGFQISTLMFCDKIWKSNDSPERNAVVMTPSLWWPLLWLRICTCMLHNFEANALHSQEVEATIFTLHSWTPCEGMFLNKEDP